MKDLIIFEVAKNRYAIDIEHIQRITQIPVITDIPNAHPFIEGMMSYENRVVKVVGFRQMVGLKTYDEELKALFSDLKQQHKVWVETLQNSVQKGVSFHLTTNPHLCNLGKWLDNFTSYDDHVSQILKELNDFHKRLHHSAIDVIELAKSDQAGASHEVDTSVMEIYDLTMYHINQFIAEFNIVANSLQKLLLYHGSKTAFAIKVVTIIDIAHIDEKMIQASDEHNKVSEFLDLSGVIELDGKLINVIRSIDLPAREVS
ncbi:MAG: chemotaxis protein CheW [Campylobacterales bacterium]|nr:chemotaxis protein CheW [Campylobacterales bacterium]